MSVKMQLMLEDFESDSVHEVASEHDDVKFTVNDESVVTLEGSVESVFRFINRFPALAEI